jgi:REP element-mobilizing transposase RayT
MPRLARVTVANEIYHVINRSNGRLQIFSTVDDYKLFEQCMLNAKELTDMRILAYTIIIVSMGIRKKLNSLIPLW